MDKLIKGFGVVGTWVEPKEKLGGTMPKYLEDTRDEALESARLNTRLFKFKKETEQWLCEITIKPIKRVNLTRKRCWHDD